MIPDVDDALRALVAEDLLAGAGATVAFDAPTTEWAARRTGPVVNLFLYDVREDLARQRQGEVVERAPDGRPVARRDPPRYFALSYLITAWTSHPTDEHRLLSTLLAGLAAHDELPAGHLAGSLAALGLAVPMSVASPPGDGRALADIWSALGGQLKPSLDLVVTAPLTPARRPAPPPVTERVVAVRERPGPRRPHRRRT
ncbi:hypothetical protein GCM10010123_45060 [Pilimelia anulata]|uniref:Pvc16 N-terminal domain-containing protein n=1 Tax=Pilimelia anulata TaxID=53371 RepID=A0A8J3BKC3_9ACTN|nr:DUF4255 domain-containing protein [Pilimelia anulata]GGK10115.1 hypothetical protein GCM10010123_45060 [Pilimelia anulata]